MRLKTSVTLTLCLALFVSLSVGAAFHLRSTWLRRAKVMEQTEVKRPPVHERTEVPDVIPELSSSSRANPAINWDVPFTSQAPHAEWDAVHKEACEEAAILMVLRYFQDQPILGPDDAEAGLQEIFAKNESFGYGIDTTAEEVANVIRSMAPELGVTLLRRPTVSDLESELIKGSLIIVPAQGQFLENPYFRVPGPPYHMLVLRGFTDDGYVITNDPGTKRGEAFVYRWETLMYAMHDWNGGDVVNGEKVVVVVREGVSEGTEVIEDTEGAGVH